MKRLAEILKRIKEIQAISEARSASPDEWTVLEKELDELIVEKKALEDKEIEIRTKFVEGNKVVIVPETGKVAKREVNIFETLEYRNEFREYVLGKNETILKRADATTATTDIGAVIPTTILNKVIEAMLDVGEIYALITKTNYPGGLDIPISSAKPTATWVAEGSTAEKQKKVIGKISFSYYKLQIKVATTLVASAVSLDLFESTVADNIAEAMVYAIEVAVLNGTGIGSPLGITVDPAITNRPVFAVADATWQGWKTKFINKIPTAYRKKRTGVIITNPLTWDKYMDGLVDSTGQPLARVTVGLNGEEVHRFMGKKVILRDELEDLDTAVASLSQPFLIYIDLKDYLLNSNLQITSRRYFDEDTDEYVQKTTLIADGKTADINGAVVLQTPAV